MKHNVGTFDAGARFVLGCILLFLSVEVIGAWGLLGLLLWLTGGLAYCPLYRLLHVDTAAWEARWEKRHPHTPPDLHHLS